MADPKDSTQGVLRNTSTALEAVARGFQPIPLVSGDKKARMSGWPRMRWDNSPEGRALVKEKFDQWAEEGHGGIGVLVGAPSGNLVDIDLDHPKTMRLKDHFLPRTAMRSGRPSRPNSHYWYIAEDDTLQDSRTYKLPKELEPADSQMIVEYRSTGGQTALPGNVHPTGETYTWGGMPWGGDEGPAVVNGRVLAVQVALLGFCTLLVNYWPNEGGRHEAYLALAGGLLRVGESVHPYWERNAGVIIGAIADATNDDEGPEGRITEVMDSTLRRLREGKNVQGFGKLSEIIGPEAVKQARVILAEIESLAGVPSRTSGSLSLEKIEATIDEHAAEREAKLALSEEDGALFRDPLEERLGTWEAVDLDPYLSGQVETIAPAVLERTDGQALMYPGRLNMLYGPSESAKSWIALHACMQLMERGERVVYLDFEDEPVNTLSRMRALGAGYDDLRNGFVYVRPEDPIATMQKSRWGDDKQTEVGQLNESIFQKLLDDKDPSLIVADGMTMIYGLHGLDSNDTVQTDTITSWLKSLTRNGRSTVLIIDHTAKNPVRGSLPIGSQHKVAMVQGTLLQAYPVTQPMPGAVGEVELIVLKDRPGQVRKIAEKSGEKAQLAARVVMDSTTEGQTLMTLRPPSGTSDKVKVKSDREIELDLRAQEDAKKFDRIRQDNYRVLALWEGELGRVLTSSEILHKLHGSSVTDAQKRHLSKILLRLRKENWVSMVGGTKGASYVLEVGYPTDEDETQEGSDE